MKLSRLIQVVSLIGLMAAAAASQAAPIVGCNAASRTNVDCADIFGGVSTGYGINFYTHKEYHVGYRRGVLESTVFMDRSMNVSRHAVFADSRSGIATAEQGSGNTVLIEFDAEAALTGLVLSGLGRFDQGDRQANRMRGKFVAEMARVTAYDSKGVKVFEQLIESRGNYAYINFGYVVPQISTLLISSGGGLPGLESSNINVSYFITALPEPGSLLLIFTGMAALALRRRFIR